MGPKVIQVPTNPRIVRGKTPFSAENILHEPRMCQLAGMFHHLLQIGIARHKLYPLLRCSYAPSAFRLCDQFNPSLQQLRPKSPPSGRLRLLVV